MSEYEAAQDVSAAHSTGVVPVYPATENLKSTKIRELVWNGRGAIRHFVEPLPAWLRIAERLPDRPAAIDAVHFPEDEEEEPEARRRLAFEELFLLELALAARRRARERGLVAAPLEPTGQLVDPWVASLPFELTGDQRRARAEIARRGLTNVSVVDDDALATTLKKQSFDLVFERLVMINVSARETLLAERACATMTDPCCIHHP